MKYVISIVLLVVVAGVVAFWPRPQGQPPDQTQNFQTQMADPKKSNMKLSSAAFEAGGLIPAQYTCDGANTHPPLSFEDVPAEAKSLVLIVEDPDVPKDRVPSGVIDHWVVFNIPPKTVGAKEGEPLSGTYGSNSSGQAAYTGPCHPDREHRYFFRLYALDTQIALKKGAPKNDVLEAIDGHVIAQAELMGRYDRAR